MEFALLTQTWAAPALQELAMMRLGVQVGVRYPGQIITTHSGRPPLQQILSRGDKQLPLPRSKADVERNSDNSPDAQETLQV